TRVEHAVNAYKSPVLYDLKVVDSSQLYVGVWEVDTPGRDGEMTHMVEEVTYDGIVVRSRELSSDITRDPETRVVRRGVRDLPTPEPTPAPTPKPASGSSSNGRSTPAKTPPPTQKPGGGGSTQKPTQRPAPTAAPNSGGAVSTVNIGGVDYPVKKAVTCKITAYTHTGRKTSTGTWPARGTIAVQPNKIPYGTHVYIPGYGIGIAADTGPTSYNSMAGYWIDLFMDSEKECRTWGVKNLTIYILD
ncbi:MAG: 3D domain-containing protein, partial [Clostridia bacterium]|nr:3D domain-containing protein [Clostridia bacterium]